MHFELVPAARPVDPPIDFWALMTGRSVSIAAAVLVDLVRLLLFMAKQSLIDFRPLPSTARPAGHRCPGGARRWQGCIGTGAR